MAKKLTVHSDLSFETAGSDKELRARQWDSLVYLPLNQDGICLLDIQFVNTRLFPVFSDCSHDKGIICLPSWEGIHSGVDDQL
jgi:hypothetical protein